MRAQPSLRFYTPDHPTEHVAEHLVGTVASHDHTGGPLRRTRNGPALAWQLNKRDAEIGRIASEGGMSPFNRSRICAHS